jgi:N-methylhydantoinase A
LGGLLADVKNDFIRTVFVDAEPGAASLLREAFAALRAEAERWLRHDQGFDGPAACSLSADMRYRGQSFEIEVPIEDRWLGSDDIGALIAAFHRQHALIYDFSDETAEVQIINLRLVIAGAATIPECTEEARIAGEPLPERRIDVWYDGESRNLPLYHREALRHGHGLNGPAVIAQEDTTICIPAGFAGSIDAYGNLHLVWQE